MAFNDWFRPLPTRPSPQPPPEPTDDHALKKHLAFKGLARRYPHVASLQGDGVKLSPMPISTLAHVIWVINRANGFADYSGDGIPVALALVHDEISEAYTEVPYLGNPALAEEIADVFIRTLDLTESVFPGRTGKYYIEPFLQPAPQMASVFIGATLLELHHGASRCLRSYRKVPERHHLMPDTLLLDFGRLATATANFGQIVTPDFDRVVLDKLEKNALRPYRHGGKRI